jgi:D-Tyr-tRNAtyr deacylase
MYHAFVDECRKGLGADRVQSGIFGSTCDIALVNDVSARLIVHSRSLWRLPSRN